MKWGPGFLALVSWVGPTSGNFQAVRHSFNAAGVEGNILTPQGPGGFYFDGVRPVLNVDVAIGGGP
jgi:hypothetical protein